jgi:hypothetical protein
MLKLLLSESACATAETLNNEANVTLSRSRMKSERRDIIEGGIDPAK